ncbi:MAG: type II CRISPR RNA-guided endonuclease Cas9 [Clostridia bacterium]
MGKISKDYYIGLDMGSSSVGWAVTDLDYNILQFRNRDMWGSRLFEEAQVAEERRTFRATRRRIDRRKLRIELLQELFSEEIAKKDFAFFQRLKISNFYYQDKEKGIIEINNEEIDNKIIKAIDSKNSLFNDENYNDKEYYKNYPTIYHLRKALIEKDEKMDIRLVYLAVHNIIKYRGNFLYEGQNFEQGIKINITLQEIQNWLIEREHDNEINFGDIYNLQAVLESKKGTLTQKKADLIKFLKANSPIAKEIISAIVGGSCNLSKLFDDEIEVEGVTNFKFSENKYEEEIKDKLLESLGEDFRIIELLKAVYDWGRLKRFCAGKNYISDAMIEIYDNHKTDLKKLKNVMRDYISTEYDNMFNVADKGINNYCKYTGHLRNKNKQNGLIEKKCSKEDFYKYVKKVLNTYLESIMEINDFKELDNSLKNGKDFVLDSDKLLLIKDKGYEIIVEILKQIAIGDFLPKQLAPDNGVIPYQLHEIELKKILQNASKYYPFLDEKDDDNYSTREKIIKLLKFRIPYYVGPLNNTHLRTEQDKSGFAWVVRKQKGKVTPWNFDDLIDKDKSAENFIRNMTNKCTYLAGKDVLAKNSLLYSKYLAYNTLNKITVNGEFIKVDLKEKIVEGLYKKQKKISINSLKKELLKNGAFDKSKASELEIGGIDIEVKEISGSLSSYITLKNYFNDKVDTNNELMEDIINYATIFDNDSNMLRDTILKKYPNVLDLDEQKCLDKIHFSGWGNFSKEFLLLELTDINGEINTIIDILKNTNLNLNEILYDPKYNAQEVLNAYNKNDNGEEFDYKKVEELYCSPSVKRSIWQTMQIIKEIVKIMDCPPKKIFVEMARDSAAEIKKNKNKRTISRKETLLEKLNNIKNDEDNKNLIEALNDENDQKMRSDRLYFYYAQMGRCAYTGEKIDLSNLFTDSYDIDHILPRALVKDDSLENKVLVKKSANQIKKDIYPLSESIQAKQKANWKLLLDKKLITSKKYEKLTRTEPITQEELLGFVNRQLVTTRQATLSVTKILKNCYGNTEIVYSKAGNISDFRKENDIIKVRDVNNLHHAKDAYLNIVVGNIYNVKYNHNANWYKQPNHEVNLKNLYNYEIKGANGQIVWQPNTTVKLVKNYILKNTPLITRQSYQGKGTMFALNIKSKGGDKLVPLNNNGVLSDTNKYGGYGGICTAYFSMIEYQKGTKIIKCIEPIPIFVAIKIKNQEDLKKYFESKGKKNITIIKEEIKIKSLIEINGVKSYITGVTDNNFSLTNAEELLLDREMEEYLGRIIKFNNKQKENKNKNKEKENQERNQNTDIIVINRDNQNKPIKTISKDDNLKLYEQFTKKLGIKAYKRSEFKTSMNMLIEKKESFVNLNLVDQINFLLQVLKLFKCDAGLADLTLLGGFKNAGKIRHNMNISPDEKITLINYSITGLHCNKKEF